MSHRLWKVISDNGGKRTENLKTFRRIVSRDKDDIIKNVIERLQIPTPYADSESRIS